MNHIWHLRPHKTGYLLDIGRTQFPCLIGKSGLVAAGKKKEGDGATPKGCWPVRCLYYRPDRIARYQLPARLPLSMRALNPQDGWCDDAGKGLYNYPVRLPFSGSHEKLWRTDGLYNLILPLGYNDAPPAANKGSAIFLHCADKDSKVTKGCLALTQADLLAAIQQIHNHLYINI